MNSKSYDRFILIFLSLTLLLTTVALAEDYDADVVYSMGEYYLSFANEELDEYMSWNYLEEYSKEAIQQKRESLVNLWENIEVLEYDYFNNLQTDVQQQIAIARYSLRSIIQYSDGEFEETKDITTLFYFRYPDWKVVVSGESAIIDGLLSKYVEEIKTYTNTTGYNLTEGNNNNNNSETKPESEETLSNNTKPEKIEATCNPDFSEFEKIKDYNLDQIPGASKLIGDNKFVLLKTETKEITYNIKSNLVNIAEGKPDYTITITDCTIDRLWKGANPQIEYNNKNIQINAESFGGKIKVGFSKLLYNIYNLFKKPATEIWVEAETGELASNGEYTHIGPTSRGEGEIYLGDGGSTVKYTIKVPKNQEYHLYISITDDALHQSGTRDATFTINNLEPIKYKHISKNTMQNDAWEWETLEKVKLKKGMNTITITKDKSTSAAFIMDKFVLSENELRLT